MNKLALLQFGDMIQNTAARNILLKAAQMRPGHQAMLGALVGGLGGGLAGNRLDANLGSEHNYGTLAGVLGGAAAGYNMAAPHGYTPLSRNAFLAMRNDPGVMNTLGMLGGAYAGYNAPGALGVNDASFQTKLLGGLAGGFAGWGLGGAARQGIQNAAARHYVSGLTAANAENMANTLHNAGATSMPYTLQREIYNNDPDKLVAQQLVNDASKSLLHKDNTNFLHGLMTQDPRSASANFGNFVVNHAGSGSNMADAAAAMGIHAPSMFRPAYDQLSGLIGKERMQQLGGYVNPTLMLGGGLVGANMLGSAYQKYRDVVDYDPNAKNKNKPQLTLGLG